MFTNPDGGCSRTSTALANGDEAMFANDGSGVAPHTGCPRERLPNGYESACGHVWPMRHGESAQPCPIPYFCPNCTLARRNWLRCCRRDVGGDTPPEFANNRRHSSRTEPQPSSAVTSGRGEPGPLVRIPLGPAVTLRTLPGLGFVPDEVAGAPPRSPWSGCENGGSNVPPFCSRR